MCVGGGVNVLYIEMCPLLAACERYYAFNKLIYIFLRVDLCCGD